MNPDVNPDVNCESATAESAAPTATGRPNRPLGRTGIEVTDIGVGTGELGDMTAVYGYRVDDERADAMLAAVLDGPFTMIDTSNGYGHGRSEERIGRALRARGGLDERILLTTKVDPAPTGPFDGARVHESIAESRRRLGVDRLRLLYLHDPERIGFEAAVAPDGPWTAMVGLQQDGVVDHIGVAGGPIDLLRRFVETGQASVVLTHNRYTLLDRSAEPLLEDCSAAGVAVVNAAPFGGGMLARGPAETRYSYREAAPEVVAAARSIADVCADHGVPPAAAALQFSLREPRIISTLVGMSRPERVQQTIDLAEHPIPDELWARLSDLAPPPQVWLG